MTDTNRDTEQLLHAESLRGSSESTKQIGKVAVARLSQDLNYDELNSGSDEPGLYDPLDPYGVPDESDSLKALSNIREIENHYDNQTPASQQIDIIDEIEDVNIIDDFSIPDEPESIAALLQTRELEKNYSVNPVYNVDSQINKVEQKRYKITSRALERMADTTGQSEDTILLEHHWTRDDVEPSSED